ncbi:MAG: DMT family transporter, partial [Candidatus Thermoplasmatota archaeon]|nr:DMT family transporter [Candidatus Thermoplasmatota archaeon]
AAFLYWRQDVDVTLSDGILAAGSCVIGVVGFLCFFESIMDGQVSIAGTISAAYPALTVLGALLLLSEELTATQAVGVFAIISGVAALSYEPNPGSKSAMPKRSLVFALLAFCLWGLWSLTSKMAIDRVGAGNIFGFYVVSSLTAPLLYAWFRRIRPGGPATQNPGKRMWLFGAIGLAINVIGAFAYSFALEEGAASLVVPISSAYPLVTIILAVGLLREKVSGLQAGALAVVVSGLILIGVSL